MTNWNYFETLNYLISKAPEGNVLSSEEYQQQFNYCQIQYMKKKLGLPEEYQPTAAISKSGYGISEKITSDLGKFVVVMGYNNSTPLVFSNGFAAVPTSPTSIFHIIGMTHTIKDESCENGSYLSPVEYVSRGEYQMRITGTLMKPTYEYAIVTRFDSKFSIEPRDIRIVNFDYIRSPKEIVMATTINSSTGEEEYDSVNSVESEWNVTNNYDILSIILEKIGINLRSQEIIQEAMLMEQKGV